VIVEAAQLGEPKSQKATSKSRINTDILYEQETRREIIKMLTKQKKTLKIVTETRENSYGTRSKKTHMNT
jgi:hypothetical protein